jgi:hypothetical protein
VIAAWLFLRYNAESGGWFSARTRLPGIFASLAAEGSRMLRLMLTLPLSFVLAVPALAAVPSASPDPKTLAIPAQELSKARELVQQLGSEQFNEREAAEEELAKMGRAARVALIEGVNTDPSQEVRTRCQTLLPKANALEMKARLEVFLADTQGKYEHDLPGWREFRATVRGEWRLLGYPLADTSLDKTARAVYVDLLSSTINRQIVMAVGGPLGELNNLVAGRRQELYNQKYGRVVVVGGVVTSSPALRREPTAEDIVTLLFAESFARTTRPAGRNVAISVLLNASGFMSAAQAADDKGKVYRAIAVAWLESRQDPLDMQYAMTIANSLGLTEQAVRLAVRLFETKGAQVYARGNAATQLARLGNKSHIPLLEKAFTDDAVLGIARVTTPNKPVNEWPTYEIQVRDVALAVSVILTGEKLEDYGFGDMFKANGNAVGTAFSHTRYYLEEDKRQAAFDKWKKEHGKAEDAKK